MVSNNPNIQTEPSNTPAKTHPMWSYDLGRVELMHPILDFLVQPEQGKHPSSPTSLKAGMLAQFSLMYALLL